MKKWLFTAVTIAAAISSADDHDGLVVKHSKIQGLDPNLVRAVIFRESRGNPNAISNKNARGLMQVIPPTAARMGVNPKHLYDPEQNIIAGTRYLRFLTDRFNGHLDYILAGYNAGEGAVEKYRGIPPYRETRHYVVEVKNRYAQLSNGSVPQKYKAVNVRPQNYENWVMGVDSTVKAQTKAEPVKVVKRVVVKEVAKPPTQAAVGTEKTKQPKSSSFVQTLDEKGNFVSL